jgi:predicted esterase
MQAPSLRWIAGALALLLLTPAWTAAQALPNVNTLRVQYNSRKTTVNPQGELKVQIDAIDTALAEAIRLGQLGEARRQLAKGMALLGGMTWTPALDYRTSLVVRADRIVLDSSVPFAVRLEQIYAPAIELGTNLTAKATLRPQSRAPQPGVVTAPVEIPPRELGAFEGVARDLRESPFLMDLDLSSTPDGAYQLAVELFDGATSLGAASLGLVLQKGLDARLRALDDAASKLPESLGADVRYPGDYIRKVNRGRVGMGSFDVAAELAAAEKVLAAARAGKDPFQGRTGDMERHYLLRDANEVMPYRVYVPAKYSDARPAPLVIALHGLGANEDSMFDGYERSVPKLAEQHGFLVAAPMGYRVDGFYGSGLLGTGDAESRRRTELSEKDVLEVLRLMRATYKVDDSRIFLMGHSMGAIGTWYLGAKYPDIWAGLAAFSGVGSLTSAERMKDIPQFVVHGDADPTVNVSGSRTMVAALKKLGAEVTYIEVAGGNHTNVVVPNMAQAFDFFAARKKSGTAVTKQ